MSKPLRETEIHYDCSHRGITQPAIGQVMSTLQGYDLLPSTPEAQVLFAPYRMDSRHNGLCMVFNNMNFEKRPGSARRGSEKDIDSIKETFSRFGFAVELHMDTKKDQMIEILTQTAKRYRTSYNCFVCFFMSHGRSGDILLDTDRKEVSITELVSLMDGKNCVTLRGKPKLFFVQMCRGDEYMQGVEIHSDGGSDEDEEDDILSNPPVPFNQDILVAFCTTTGYKSFRYPEYGSPFIQVLTKVLKERGHVDDILLVMTRVTNLVGRLGNKKRKMCPYIKCTLARPLTFSVQNDGNTGAQ